jgi:hypothetical protein
MSTDFLVPETKVLAIASHVLAHILRGVCMANRDLSGCLRVSADNPKDEKADLPAASGLMDDADTSEILWLLLLCSA